MGLPEIQEKGTLRLGSGEERVGWGVLESVLEGQSAGSKVSLDLRFEVQPPEQPECSQVPLAASLASGNDRKEEKRKNLTQGQQGWQE